MKKSPGHKKWPDHQVREHHVDGKMRVEVAGELVAESDDVIEVAEDDRPPRYYFPRSDVKLAQLDRNDSTSECPFKGTAHYYDLRAGGRRLEGAVWTYEDPYEEHQALRDRLAFYDDKLPEIHISPVP